MTPSGEKSRRKTRAGWIVGALVVLFLILDSGVKIFRLDTAVNATVATLGYPDWSVFWIGALLLVCTALYMIPRTAILGAILLTGYLGGATAAQVRDESPSFWFPVLLGILLWTALYLRDGGVRSMIPTRTLRS